jgi:hypothetical protein
MLATIDDDQRTHYYGRIVGPIRAWGAINDYVSFDATAFISCRSTHHVQSILIIKDDDDDPKSEVCP